MEQTYAGYLLLGSKLGLGLDLLLILNALSAVLNFDLWLTIFVSVRSTCINMHGYDVFYEMNCFLSTPSNHQDSDFNYALLHFMFQSYLIMQ